MNETFVYSLSALGVIAIAGVVFSVMRAERKRRIAAGWTQEQACAKFLQAVGHCEASYAGSFTAAVERDGADLKVVVSSTEEFEPSCVRYLVEAVSKDCGGLMTLRSVSSNEFSATIAPHNQSEEQQ